MQTVERVKRIVTTFLKGTGVEVLYFNEKLKHEAIHCPDYVYQDFVRLSMGQVEGFLREAISKAAQHRQGFVTYFLDNRLVCNIVLLERRGGCRGALVTRPVSLRPVKGSEAKALLEKLKIPVQEREQYKQALLRSPVMSYDRVITVGQILSVLCRSVFDGKEARQILRREEDWPPVSQMAGTDASPFSCREAAQPEFISQPSHALYLALRDCISSGDSDALVQLFSSFQAPAACQETANSVQLRRLKDSLIKMCAFYCFIAIEAGASYSRTMEVSEALIRHLETMDNVNDVYEWMKVALLAFTKAVAMTRMTAYSRPVQMTLEYIKKHYAEKITLSMLARRAGLSDSYLSNLVAKETGISLTDHINYIRVEKSKQILAQSNVTISQLARQVGYCYSNHFARVFKRYTGMSPLEFKKSLSEQQEENRSSAQLMRLFSEYLKVLFTVFPGCFDLIRVLNPLESRLLMEEPSGKDGQRACFSFWERETCCSRCISRMALERNEPCLKLERKKDRVYFMLSIPIAIGGKRYVMEALKGISDNFFDCTQDAPQPGPAPHSGGVGIRE